MRCSTTELVCVCEFMHWLFLINWVAFEDYFGCCQFFRSSIWKISNNNHLTALCLGLPGWAGSRRNIHPLMWECPWGDTCHCLGFIVQMEDNKSRRADNPPGCQPILTNWCPHLHHPHHFLRWMPFLPRPSQFILAWAGTKCAGLHTK